MSLLLTDMENLHLTSDDAEEVGAIKLEAMFLKSDLNSNLITQERFNTKIKELQDDYDALVARYNKK